MHIAAIAVAARSFFEICAIGKSAMIEVFSRLRLGAPSLAASGEGEPGAPFFTRRFFVAPPPVQDLLL